MKRLLFAAAVVSAALGAFAAAPANAILDGQPSSDPAHAGVGMALGVGWDGSKAICSGVAISERHFLTSAHCFRPGTPVKLHFEQDGHALFADHFFSNAPRLEAEFVGSASPHPLIPFFDVAVVTLTSASPLPTPYAQIGSVSAMRSPLTAVGYGIRVRDKDLTWGPSGPNEIASRYAVATWLVDTRERFAPYYMKMSSAKGGACMGDSGGPIFASDGSLVAITAFAKNPNCAGVVYALRLDIDPVRSFIDDELAGARP